LTNFAHFGETKITIFFISQNGRKTRGMSHCGLAIHIKMNLKAKEELRKLKYFTMQKYNLQKTFKKKPKSHKIL